MKVNIIIVTYNRLKDLQKSLKAYEAQTFPPAILTVVDNHSTDGTIEFLHQWEQEPGVFERKVLFLPENTGGSGGFSTGMEQALKTDCDWVFVSDDDAIPHEDMLEKLAGFAQDHPEEMKHTVALCAGVHNVDHFSGIHRCRIRRSVLGRVETFVPEEEYQKEFFPLEIYSFVGTTIKREALERAGVARGDFFIYNDDYEHAVRVGACGNILCVPASVMEHTDNLVQERRATWRDYYATRNGVLMHKEHFGGYAAAMRAARRLGMTVITGNPKKLRVVWTAIRDAYKGKTGLHPIYKPGWNG